MKNIIHKPTKLEKASEKALSVLLWAVFITTVSGVIAVMLPR